MWEWGRASRAGHARSTYNVGWCYEHGVAAGDGGVVVARSLPRAERYYRLAAEQRPDDLATSAAVRLALARLWARALL